MKRSRGATPPTLQIMKKILAAAATACLSYASITGTPQSANAATGRCYETESGATVCILGVWSSKSGPNHKIVQSSINGSIDYDEVYCNPNYRNAYKPNMWGIACYEFN